MISVVQGVEYPHEAVIDKCLDQNGKACGRIVKGENVCAAYLYPDKLWRRGNCPTTTHITTIIAENAGGKKRVGQQKQKKKR